MKSETSLYTESTAPISQEDSVFEKGPEPSEASTLEILPSEAHEKEERSSRRPSHNVKRSWLPWKRADRRDQQLAQLRDGYSELIGLIRSISGHLEREDREASNVTALIQTLPPALNSFEKLAHSQEQVTSILGKISSHMEDSNSKDQQLLENMQGFNSTIKEVSTTNENALGALTRVQDRIGESDERMKHLFEQASQTNEVVGSLMMRLERRLFISNLILAILIAGLIILGVSWSLRSSSGVAVAPPAPPLLPTTGAPGMESPPTPDNLPADALIEEDAEDAEGSLAIEPIEEDPDLATPLPDDSLFLAEPNLEEELSPREPVESAEPESLDFLEIEF